MSAARFALAWTVAVATASFAGPLALAGPEPPSAPASAAPEAAFDFDRTPGKLPKSVVPIDYDIALRPNVRDTTFAGSERVRVRVREATRTIRLDTHALAVTTAALAGGAPAQIATDDAAQQTTLTFARPVAPGVHVLALRFSGKIGDEDQGLFLKRYASPGGEKTMLATQFESADARRMFPCWDEPAFRATFRLTVTVPAPYEAVSNMPAETTSVADGEKTVVFARTPRMASYLLVLCAGEFGMLSGSANGTAIRVIAPKGREDRGAFALDAAEKLLAYYDDYFGVAYPLPKLDLVAIPGGFPGAMENWGGITFDERALLFDPARQPADDRQTIFVTIAHEMSHQWFGDLVTPAWWDDLWLSESFADWMETKASDALHPEWHLWERTNGDVERAMRTDASAATHPLRLPVADDTQADAAFDEITYQKGGAFVRMLESYLGADTFRAGVRAYVRANAYGNATAANVYAALGTAAQRDVGAFARTWTDAPGVPLVTATERCRNGAFAVDVEQQRFFAQPQATPSTQAWQIPIAFAPATVPAQTVTALLAAPNGAFERASCAGPVVVNAGAVGYFRVRYDRATQSRLASIFEQLAAPDRIRLIADADALVANGTLKPDPLLVLLEQLGDDRDLGVWERVFGVLGDLADAEPSDDRAAFDAFVRRVEQPAFSAVGWDPKPDEPVDVTALRPRLIEALGSSGDEAVIAEARSRFAAFAANPDALSPDARVAVLDVVGANADAAAWERLHALYASAKSRPDGNTYRSALWRARDPALAARNLAMATNGDLPSESGAFAPLSDVTTVARTGRQPALAWRFFVANWPTLSARLSPFDKTAVVPSLLSAFRGGATPDELVAWGEANLPAEAGPELVKERATLAGRESAATRIRPDLQRWIAAHAGPATSAPK